LAGYEHKVEGLLVAWRPESHHQRGVATPAGCRWGSRRCGLRGTPARGQAGAGQAVPGQAGRPIVGGIARIAAPINASLPPRPPTTVNFLLTGQPSL